MIRRDPQTTGGPKTMVALFCYGGVWPMTMVNTVRDLCGAATIMGIVQHREEARRLGYIPSGRTKAVQPWEVALTIPHGDALIDRSRSISARDFLKTDAEVLLMVDHDLEWRGAATWLACTTCGQPSELKDEGDPKAGWHCKEHPGVELVERSYEGDLLHLARLCAKTKSIVGAVVSKRTRGEGVACLFKEERMLHMGQDALIEVHYVGAAFTAYHRSVLEAVYGGQADSQPGFRPVFLPALVDHPQNPKEKLHLSEDWALCHRASQLGIPSYVTTRPIIKHWGHYPYTVTTDSEPDESKREREEEARQAHPAVPRKHVTGETSAPIGPPPDQRGQLEGLTAEHMTTETVARPLTISLLHATRGRPKQARKAYDRWMQAASGEFNLEYVLSVDEDDESMPMVGLSCEKHDGAPMLNWPDTVKTVVGRSRPGPVDAYNRALYASTGDVIVQVHDDIEPPKDWDKQVVEAFGPNTSPNGCANVGFLLHVDDGTGDKVNPDKPWLLTILVGTRAWFKQAGFFYHPGYPSVFCDDDVSQMAMKAGAVIEAKHIKFKHAWGGADGDETYRRAYAQENWETGRANYEKRKAAGFPCEPERWTS